ncbi:hypothetical protein K469DRAFT_798232 [Zopfia rhizophila CBS 207.26]|uniref:Uncharacterized protein n=1 Tax=Zopfia rhizophila CBS 207.26 TaxID=1314779 RepID=A0A6A6DL97_9PEZI|nr:hypothetical protein K469DRAFT_798232 [Zopfia rhizophila CBS 207.26]
MTCISRLAAKQMSTISLDQEQKANIVADINEYLHLRPLAGMLLGGFHIGEAISFMDLPARERLRSVFRSLVFLGSTSTASALLRLDSLNQTSTSCSADIRRVEDTNKDLNEEDDSGTNNCSLTKVSKLDPTPRNLGQPTNGFKSLISLSGLLSVIDGVASHEGRVLIMTTNHPEKLDAALIRPGRVDMQVQFSLATKGQIRDIFYRMYSTEFDKMKDSSVTLKPSNGKTTAKTIDSAESSLREKGLDDEFYELLHHQTVLDNVELKKLREMADKFASQLPECTLSPAEIQGFLLMRKKEPCRALEEVGN